MFAFFVGDGLADAAAAGNVFASPDPPTPLSRRPRAVDAGKGVLFVYGNYSGDNLNFDIAAEMLRKWASPPGPSGSGTTWPRPRAAHRGPAGDRRGPVCHKIAGRRLPPDSPWTRPGGLPPGAGRRLQYRRGSGGCRYPPARASRSSRCRRAKSNSGWGFTVSRASAVCPAGRGRADGSAGGHPLRRDRRISRGPGVHLCQRAGLYHADGAST